MKTTLSRFLFVISVNGLVSVAQAQGWYTTAEGGPGGYIDTHVIVYDGYGNCSGLTAWNSLDGQYVSGWAPADLQSGRYGTDGVDYVWSWGVTLYFADPFGGCGSFAFSVSELLGLHTTYYQGPILYEDGSCRYAALACTSGIPTCDSRNYLGYYFGSTCPAIIKVGYLVAAGYCTAGLAFPTEQTVRMCN